MVNRLCLYIAIVLLFCKTIRGPPSPRIHTRRLDTESVCVYDNNNYVNAPKVLNVTFYIITIRGRIEKLNHFVGGRRTNIPKHRDTDYS